MSHLKTYLKLLHRLFSFFDSSLWTLVFLTSQFNSFNIFIRSGKSSFLSSFFTSYLSSFFYCFYCFSSFCQCLSSFFNLSSFFYLSSFCYSSSGNSLSIRLLINKSANDYNSSSYYLRAFSNSGLSSLSESSSLLFKSILFFEINSSISLNEILFPGNKSSSKFSSS